jgi:predicted DNA-binding transcriptional regulator YafY
VLDPERTLPPLNITAEEAIAIAVALERSSSMPFEGAARSALRKLLAVMPRQSRERARALAERIHLGPNWLRAGAQVPGVLQAALATGEVLRLRYQAGDGTETTRLVEPMGLVASTNGWYLFGWCRLRQAVRSFRLDRVQRAEATGETAPPRPLDLPALGLHFLDRSRLDERLDLL